MKYGLVRTDMHSSERAYSFRRRLLKLTTLLLLSYCTVVWSGVVLFHSEHAHAMSKAVDVIAKPPGEMPNDGFAGGASCEVLCKVGTCAGIGVLDRPATGAWSKSHLQLRPIGTDPPAAWHYRGPFKPPRSFS